MKKLILHFLLLIPFLTFTPIFADSHWLVQVGGNLSKFNVSKTHVKFGNTAIILKNWSINNNTSIKAGIMYCVKSSSFENIIVYTENSDIGIQNAKWINIHSTINSIEIPIYFQKQHSLSNLSSLIFNIGTSLNIINNFSSSSEIIDEIEYQEVNYDYITDPNRQNEGSFMGLDLSIGYCIKNISFHLLFQKSFSKIEVLRSIKINEELDSIHFLIGFQF